MEVLRAALRSPSRVAILIPGAQPIRYQQLLAQAGGLAKEILELTKASQAPVGPNTGPRVALLAPPGRDYVEGMWATWLADGISVPLCLTHPPKDLAYVMEDAQTSLVLATPELAKKVQPLLTSSPTALHILNDPGNSSPASVHFSSSSCSSISRSSSGNDQAEAALARSEAKDGALIIYTSGTTGKPKGVLHTHGSLAAQIHGMQQAWGWREEDTILHTLPLHHIHGIVNALLCAHASAASIEFLPSFSPTRVWESLQREEDPVSIFMGVPTMYTYLLSQYKDKMGPEEQQRACDAASRLRLTISGSGACPVSLMKQWKAISGQTLLERYGMTEAGMILSNPLEGERRPGSVGTPMPGVQVCSVPVESSSEHEDRPQGEIRVKGSNLFREYWNRPEATAAEFDEKGWFKTGDTGCCEGDPAYWRILGRTSVDIINSAGYKISALGIEDVLLQHGGVGEVAVVGLKDETLGEKVAAIIAPAEGKQVTKEQVLAHSRELLPSYQVPRTVVLVDAIPRNAMGKVNKKQLVKDLV
ncbi:hypothetical protein WJX74_006714 [Apatococcus lobatus]|uniref:Uncharacterized protein n=1 Tax=Apatococcus lobatus TaxID=904363 RepID=A0AAW1QDH2_9CHLO